MCKRGEIAVACETGDYVVGIDPVSLGEVWRVDSLPEPLEAALDGASDAGEDDDVETPVQGPFGLGVDEDGMLLVADQHRAVRPYIPCTVYTYALFPTPHVAWTLDAPHSWQCDAGVGGGSLQPA